jgi:hypothetical protein
VGQTTAGGGVDGGEDGAAGDVLLVAQDAAGDRAAEDVVAVARSDCTLHLAIHVSGVAGDDAVGNIDVGVAGIDATALGVMIRVPTSCCRLIVCYHSITNDNTVKSGEYSPTVARC